MMKPSVSPSSGKPERAKSEIHSNSTSTANWKQSLLRLLLSEYLVLYLTIVYFLIVWPMTPALATERNLLNLLSNLLPLLIVAIGQTFVLITAGIDLSITSIIALASVLGAMIMSSEGGLLQGSPGAVPIGILSMLAAGGLVGWINGMCITRFQMPPFIVTLTTMMFFSGFAIWLTQSKTIYGLPTAFLVFGKNLQVSVILTIVFAMGAAFLLSRTVFGRWVYATGHNPKAAVISGIPIRRTVLFAYVLSGLCAATASILYTGRLETGSPVLGERLLLDVIGATVIGGTSLYGGKGKVLWTFFGVLFFTVVDNSLNLLGRSHFEIMMIKGLVILLAAALDSLRNRLLASR